MAFTRLLWGFAAMVLLSGCMGGSFGPSTEWRLRNLEKNFLEFQDNQLEQNARLAALEDRMEGRAGERMDEAMDEPSKASDQAQVQDVPAARPEEKPDTAPKAHLLKSEDIPSPHQAAKQEEEGADVKPWEDYPSPEDAPAPQETPEKPVQEAAKKTEVAAKEPAPAPKKPRAAKKSVDQGRGVYDPALKLVLAGEVRKGRVALAEFMEKYPKSSLMPNAAYWTGETYYAEKRYAQAILTFKQVHQKFPKHTKAAAALLKIGYAYDRLGDKNNARFYLDALVQDYPKSEPAALARKKLKALSN
ncbi:MAG: tol-pal system protein YbgF [Thermodesulfobacteriota bacterium]|nr:tol-pal system protein YbgF [Thermodesulfobacteriota bacterium]